MSIRLKLIIMFLAIALIPLLFVSILTFNNYKNSLEANHLSQLQNLATFKAERIEAYFAGLKADMKIAQGLYNIKKNLPVLTRLAHDPNNPESLVARKKLDEQLQHMQSISGLSDIMLVNPEGMVVHASKPVHYLKDLSKGSYAEQKAFANGRDKIYLSDVYYDKEEDNRLEMLLTAPASDLAGAFIGIIAFEVDMTHIHELLKDVTGMGKTGEVLMGEKVGNEVVFLNPLRHEPDTIMKRINIGEEAGGPIQDAIQGRSGAGQLIDYSGEKVIAAWRYIPSLGWGMVAKIDAKEAFADVTNLRNLMAIILAMITVLSGVMAFSIAQSISEPIKQLSKGAEIIGRGNLDYRVGTNLKDEIGQLSRSFDKMTLNLKQTTASRDELSIEVRERKEAEAALHEERDRLKALINSVHDEIWFADTTGQFTLVNPSGSREFGLDANAVTDVRQLARSLEVLRPDGTPRPVEESPPLRALRGETVANEVEMIRTPATGELRYRQVSAAPVRDISGNIIGSVSIVHDITERKQAEDELRKNREDLSRAQAVAHTGSWRLDVQQNVLNWSDEAYKIFSKSKGVPLTYESFLDCVHPEDRKYVNQKWRQALRGKGYDIEHRIVADGQVKWVRERAELEFEKDGTLLGGFGTVTDITKRKQMEEELREAKYDLENKVEERTVELADTISALQEEAQQRIKAEGVVKAERQRFENVLEMMPAYAVLLTPDYHVAYANKFFVERFGEDKGRRCYEYLFNRTEPCEICETYTVLKTKKPHRWEWTGPDGRNYDIYDYPFTDADGSPLIMEIGVDITEHKRAEKAVRASEERYRSLTAATTQIVWTTNASGEVVDDIPSWREFTGQSLKEVKGWGWIDALHPDDRRSAGEKWSEAVRNRSLYHTEYRIRRRDGEYRSMIARGVPVLEEDGSVREWIRTCTDVTEQKGAESRQNVTKLLLELFAREDSRKAYLDSAVEVIRDWSRCEFVGIRIRDNEGNIPYESHVGFDTDFLALENALNLDRDNCLCIRTILEKRQREERQFVTNGGSFYCNDSEAFLNSLTEKQRKKNRDTCVRWGFKSISVVPIRYREKVVGAIHIADFQKDKVVLPKIQFIETTIAPLIGEAVQRFNAEAKLEEYREHLEDEVEKRTEELARSNRDLEQFAYVASHDLQEPLRAVAGFVGLLRMQLRDSLDAKKLEYMNFATDGVARMQSLISGLLEYSRIGTGEKEPEMTDSKAALSRAIAHLGGGIREFGAKITIADDMPKVCVDSTQLSQVFQNLIGNAIKFCNNETPQVRISTTRQGNAWRFAVADNGIGIEPQYAERIFQIFQRLHSRDKYPGTGVGLAICKKIVERHGGEIWVESKPGAGSTFYFTIPNKEDI